MKPVPVKTCFGIILTLFFSHFNLSNGQKAKFQDLEFVTADNENATEAPFLAISSAKEAMIGILIGLEEKSNLLSSIGPKKVLKFPFLSFLYG